MWVEFCLEDQEDHIFHLNLDEVVMFKYSGRNELFNFDLYLKTFKNPLSMKLTAPKLKELLSLLNNVGTNKS